MDRRHLLTGGIGSGKTTAASFFEMLGAVVISGDQVGHSVIAPDGEAFDAVARRFPLALVNGEIDRSLLASHVFENAAELAALEAITHPAIRRRVVELLPEDDAVTLVEVPLIADFLGPGWGRIVVDAPVSVRLQRLLARGMTQADAEARMDAQPTRGEWLEAADLVIDNRGDLESLEGECRVVWGRITSV